MTTTAVRWPIRGTLGAVATVTDTPTTAAPVQMPGVDLGRVVPMLALGWLVAAVLLFAGWLALSAPHTAINPPGPAQVVDGIEAPNPGCVANTGDPTFWTMRLGRLMSEQSGQVAGYVRGIPETLPVAKVVEDQRTGVFDAADVRWVWVCEH